MHSVNKIDENISKIAELFPNVITETIKDSKLVHAIDFNVLRQELSNYVVEGPEERYQFTWPDKRKSILLANAPIAKTLRPCREESVDFDTTENLYIEGDNLDALKLLQETYLGKVKMIYIDPPYNTGNDFVYEDDYSMENAEWKMQSGDYDEEGNRLVQNTESNGRFHTDWLNMIYPRLKLAKDLLTDDGVIFISIDDNEVENLKKICNEVFGDSNFIASFVWDGGRKNDSKRVSVSHEYILVYCKSSFQIGNDDTLWKERKDGIDDIYKQYSILRGQFGSQWFEVSSGLKKWYSSLPDSHPAKAHKHYCNADANGIYFASDLSGPDDGRKNRPRYTVLHPITQKPVPIPSRGWRWEEKRMIEEMANDRVHFGGDETSIPNGKVYLKENEYQAPSSVFYKDRRSASGALKKLFDEKVFDFPKDTSVIERLITLVCRKNDIVLDFFSGSSSTAEAVINHNYSHDCLLRFIMVQLPEATDEESRPYRFGLTNICEIGKERIRRAGAQIAKQLKENAEGKMQNDELLKEGNSALCIHNSTFDKGFRVLKVDSTNMQEVYYKPEEYKQDQLSLLTDNIKPDRTPEDLLFQVMLDLDVLLSKKIEETTLGGKKVFSVDDGYLIACFDKDITDEVVKEIAKKEPHYAIFRDSGLASDSVATNFEQIFETYSSETIRKVL